MICETCLLLATIRCRIARKLGISPFNYVLTASLRRNNVYQKRLRSRSLPSVAWLGLATASNSWPVFVPDRDDWVQIFNVVEYVYDKKSRNAIAFGLCNV